jgi:hypothetical protein
MRRRHHEVRHGLREHHDRLEQLRWLRDAVPKRSGVLELRVRGELR